jgi:DNA polymerase I-like protein with 3'-5' exonuclease and polymerase domains
LFIKDDLCFFSVATKQQNDTQMSLNFTECLMFCSGSAADLCKSAMLLIDRRLQEKGLARDTHLLLQIHDELLWEVSSAQLTNVRGESSCLNPR